MFAVIATILTGYLAPFFGYLGLLSLASTRWRPLSKASSNEDRTFVIVVPAHNESSVILTTIKSLLAMDYDRQNYRIVVVADNCSDDTAEVARGAGAEVLERKDESRRGKNFALKFAEESLGKESNPPDALVVIDADSVVQSNMLQVFSQRLASGDKWIQANNFVGPDLVGWRAQLMALAFSLINNVVTRGQHVLGLGSALRGSGMCFDWQSLRKVGLDSHGLAEDLQFAWVLRMRGEFIAFAGEISVQGQVAPNSSAAKSQRLRWEHGRVAVRKEFREKILDLDTGGLRKLLLLIDLYMLPFSRLVTLLTVAWVCFLLQSRYEGILHVLLVLYSVTSVIYLLMPGILRIMPWKAYLALIHAPKYILWKGITLLTKKPKEWVRTERNGD